MTLTLESLNPATGERIKTVDLWNAAQLDGVLREVAAASPAWQRTPFAKRARLFLAAAARLRTDAERFARLITAEMGKPIREARAEIEKCALGCEFFAENAERMLADEVIATDAAKSYVRYQPLGTLLAVMPWNYPFWQLFRAAAPAMMVGNTVVMKHASNVPQCALAIEEIFIQSGFPAGVFRTLLISAAQAEQLISDPRVHAVTLTGSEAAGRRVAAAAGTAIKKTVLELGGSDPFIILGDGNLDTAIAGAVSGRFQNTGQSCIAAKRIIVTPQVADEFVSGLRERIAALKVGDPLRDDTNIGPLARADLRDQLHHQVTASISAGAKLLLGGSALAGPGFFYAPTLIDAVVPGMAAFEEELFGPVAVIIRARDEADAMRLANQSRYGLGASIWTGNPTRGEALASELECGQVFVNGIVRSDPRLPFGGIKASGYGRELSVLGIREFVNAKTVWIAGTT
ncbi:MAG: succinate-semialdehyde dehydrogenase [Acidithiobacillales bacterium SM23_46]|nr:MAG: succinate-semialdehyde dehydrogenase [Acidithiobacillales bacterium SM23_46]KPL28908.1 MAG: succinate-semialdehyde dehydrogenase [Acidithiobacillales bacterium SM1_46]